MIYIDTLGTGCILPAFVVGYQIAPLQLSPGTMFPESLGDGELPSWLVTLEQQAGGYAVLQRAVVGIVLRLEGNQDKGKQEFSKLIAGLQSMAEGQPEKMLKKVYPDLAGLGYSRGEVYGRSQLTQLEDLLGVYLDLPAIETGIEAFVQFAACEALQYFADWSVFSCKQIGSKVDECGAESQQANYFDDSNLNLLSLGEDDKFSQEMLDELTCYASRFGLREAAKPSVFLLWENSD